MIGWCVSYCYHREIIFQELHVFNYSKCLIPLTSTVKIVPVIYFRAAINSSLKDNLFFFLVK